METATLTDLNTTCVTFRLADEMYAMEIDRVREVLDVTRITKVPQTPDFVRGVINLRGEVVPVIDLRVKFGMTATDSTVDTRILIAEIVVDGERTVLGAMADAVREVVELSGDQIGPPPRIGTRIRTDFLKALGRRDDDFIMILDVDRVFSEADLAAVQSSSRLAAEGLSGEELSLDDDTASAEATVAGAPDGGEPATEEATGVAPDATDHTDGPYA